METPLKSRVDVLHVDANKALSCVQNFNVVFHQAHCVSTRGYQKVNAALSMIVQKVSSDSKYSVNWSLVTVFFS